MYKFGTDRIEYRVVPDFGRVLLWDKVALLKHCKFLAIRKAKFLIVAKVAPQKM